MTRRIDVLTNSSRGLNGYYNLLNLWGLRIAKNYETFSVPKLETFITSLHNYSFQVTYSKSITYTGDVKSSNRGMFQSYYDAPLFDEVGAPGTQECWGLLEAGRWVKITLQYKWADVNPPADIGSLYTERKKILLSGTVEPVTVGEFFSKPPRDGQFSPWDLFQQLGGQINKWRERERDRMNKVEVLAKHYELESYLLGEY